MTTFSDCVFQYGGLITGAQFPVQSGKSIFVKPRTGSDLNTGASLRDAVQTLSRALFLATPDQNDTVYLVDEGVPAAQTETLVWGKSAVHLIGINAQSELGGMSSITQDPSVKDIDTLFFLTGQHCFISNIHIQQGVSANVATSPVALLVFGHNNQLTNCRIVGGADSSMNVAGVRAVVVDGSNAIGNSFRQCSFNIDSSISALNVGVIEFINLAGHTIFEDCLITSTAASNTMVLVKATGVEAIRGPVWFVNCGFTNLINAGATALTAAISVNVSSPRGTIILHNPCLVGATDWCAADTDLVKLLGFGLTAQNFGIAQNLTAA